MDGKLTTEAPLSSLETNETSANSPPVSTLSTGPSTTPVLSQSQLDTMYPTGEALGIQSDYLWKPGQSGNPLGRPKGTKNRITLLKLSLEQALREDAADHMQEVLQTAIKMAKKGHPGMIKLLLELHMSKSGDVDDRGTDDKITININQMPELKNIGTQSPVIIEGSAKERQEKPTDE